MPRRCQCYDWPGPRAGPDPPNLNLRSPSPGRPGVPRAARRPVTAPGTAIAAAARRPLAIRATAKQGTNPGPAGSEGPTMTLNPAYRQ